MRLKKLVPAVLLVALLTVGGCSSDTKPADSGRADKAGGSSAAAEKPLPRQQGSSVTGAEVAQASLRKVGEGQSAKFDAVITVGDQNIPMTGVSGLVNGKPAADLSMGEQITVRYVDDQLYVKSDAFGPKWIKADPDSKNPVAAQMGKTVQQTRQMGLENTTKLAEKVQTFTVAGTESVNGAQTTRYDGRITVADLVSVYPPETRQQLAQVMGDQPVKFSYWLDDQDRPAKMVQEMTVQGQSSVTTMIFSDWGKPITVTAPPAAEIAVE